MNFLKKKLKPLTSGLTSAAANVTSSTNSHTNSNSKHNKADKDLEDDLYDEYVIEAPPHPSELLALGVDPTDIDVNDPEKLRELYRKAKEEGKDKKTNSILLAKQRQKEEIEQKKKTREEWKFFDNLTARVEQVVKDSQKNLDHLKESSAIDKLTEPNYELRLSADQVFKSSATVKQEKSANNWIDFSEEENNNNCSKKGGEGELKTAKEAIQNSGDPGQQELDEFGCPKTKRSSSEQAALAESQKFIVEELLEDFGIDLRTPDQKKAQQAPQKPSGEKDQVSKPEQQTTTITQKLDIDLKAAARPRPRPNASKFQAADSVDEPNKAHQQQQGEKEVDPFDTSFVAAPAVEGSFLLGDDPFGQNLKNPIEELPPTIKQKTQETPARALDPFDTSYINL